MAKTIQFVYKDKEYTLEFTRRTIRRMEDEGFVPSEIDRKPATMIPMLFAGAFRAHHALIKPELIDEIFASIGDKENLIMTLAEMYNEPLMAMVEEPETGKNVSWTVSR